MTNSNVKAYKADYDRVLLTETLPFEIPVLYSNRHFYIFKRSLRKRSEFWKTFYKLVFSKTLSDGQPYFFKVRKERKSVRRLGLIHPRSQLDVVDFYKEYGDVICAHSSKSRVTLRAPDKIASSYYFSDEKDQVESYKIKKRVGLAHEEDYKRFLTSYFSYRGYYRIHKFFDSDEYIKHERRYAHLWCVDVAKCFDSIYTHTITWATNSKITAKANSNIKGAFGPAFDYLMRSMNGKETSGIVIGPEVSRIFAEIIFQDIDQKIISSLKASRFQLVYKKDYEIKRYVDDIFIYGNSLKVMEAVLGVVQEQLAQYRFHINDEKLLKIERPFFTPKSRVIYKVKDELSKYFESIFPRSYKSDDDRADEVDIEELVIDWPKVPSRAGTRLINHVKAICSGEDYGFESVSSYICTSIFRKLDSFSRRLDKNSKIAEQYGENIRSLLDSLIQVSFYFYTVEPTVKASFETLGIIRLSLKIASKMSGENELFLKSVILREVTNVFEQSIYSRDILSSGFEPLEKLNILLGISDLGDDFEVPDRLIAKVLCYNDWGGEVRSVEDIPIDDNSTGYFTLMSLLYYIRDRACYKKIREKIEEIICNKISKAGSLKNDTEGLMLFLDSMSCPYISENSKKIIVKSGLNSIGINRSIGRPLLNEFRGRTWFFNWDTSLDMLDELEKKRMDKVY